MPNGIEMQRVFTQQLQATTSAQPSVSEAIAEPMSQEAVFTEQQRRKKLWFAAIKPPMYTVSIIPVLVRSSQTLHLVLCSLI